jgi:hypothetical protein
VLTEHYCPTRETVPKPRTMPDQLVRERAAHALDQNRVVGVLEDGAVPLLLDVLEVLARLPLRRVAL